SDSTVGDAAERCERKADAEFLAAVEMLAGMGLLKRTGTGFETELGYLVESVERDSHIFPERRLSSGERNALLAILRSGKFGGWVREDFGKAVELASKNRDVLAGFFWAVFREVFAFSHACLLASLPMPSVDEIGDDFDAFLKKKAGEPRAELKEEVRKRRIADEKTLSRAFSDDFAFLFPRELADYLRWNVDISPAAFVLAEVMKSRKRP
ncbi:MAG: hypothetical protein AB1324_04265, partial [Candidatus Micrarchaeota archaeon]